MKCPFEDHIKALLHSGRINEATADILTRHYAKQPDHFKEEMAAASPEVNLAHLMRLIDLLDKKNEMRKAAVSPAVPVSRTEDGGKAPSKSGIEEQNETLKGKCEALEAELVAEKTSRAGYEQKALEYAKRFTDEEEERKRILAVEESKRKMLAEEHRQQLEDICCKSESEKLNLEKTLQGHSADLAMLGQEKERLARELENAQVEKQKALERIKHLEEAMAQAGSLKERCAALENEMRRVEKERDEKEAARNAFENELARIRQERDEKARAREGSEKRIKEMEALLNDKGNALSALEGDLKREKELRARAEGQFHALEKTLLDLERQINSLH